MGWYMNENGQMIPDNGGHHGKPVEVSGFSNFTRLEEAEELKAIKNYVKDLAMQEEESHQTRATAALAYALLIMENKKP